MKRKPRIKRPVRPNKATQKSGALTVNQALANPSRIKGKTLVGTDNVIVDIVQSRELGQEGFAHLIFTDNTFSTLRLEATLKML